MSMIKGKNTLPESKLKGTLKILGFCYQPKNIYGKPDFVNKKIKVAIFVDGCFWHKCPKHFVNPKNNAFFWKRKLNTNVLRDKEVNKKLTAYGWRVIRVWEHSIK